MTRGGTRYDGSPSRFDHGSIARPAVDSPHDRGARDQTNRDRPSSWSIIGRCKPCMEDPHDRGPIEPRSSRDRTPSAVESILLEPTMIDGAPGSRSMHNRGPIAARSWCDRGKNLRLFDR